jgi:very-short-patch-repair endonuclease
VGAPPRSQAVWIQVSPTTPHSRLSRRPQLLASRLVIELDGPIHDTQKEADAEREAVIESLGYRVLRFTNDEVLSAPTIVIEKLFSALNRDS